MRVAPPTKPALAAPKPDDAAEKKLAPPAPSGSVGSRVNTYA